VIHRWRSSITTGLSITALAITSGIFPGVASAAPSSTSINTLRVSPAISNIQLSPGETSATIVATVTNQTNSPLVVDITARDFGALITRAGAISFYGSGYNPATNPHGLQTSVSLLSPSLTLAPKTTEKVAVTLNSVNKLAAGGHYGAILFSPESLVASLSNTRVSIHSAVASLLFLKTASGGTQTLRLLPFSEGAVRFTMPSSNYIVFSDTGNTQTAPEGQLTLYGPSGGIISTTVINPGSGLILPGTSRLLTTALPLPNMRFARPGIYKVVLEYRNSSQTTFTVTTRSFYYINLYIFLPVVLLLVGLLYFLRWHGSELLRASKRALYWAAHPRKRPVAVAEHTPKKRTHRRIQG
jgi:hypothetical protein